MFLLLHLLEDSVNVTEADDTLGGLLVAIRLHIQKQLLLTPNTQKLHSYKNYHHMMTYCYATHCLVFKVSKILAVKVKDKPPL